MSCIDETRLHLISELLGAKQISSQLFVQYITANHEYGDGNILHMREAHFIVAVGLGGDKTMSEIAEAMSVTHGAVSQIARRLEKKGYILRRQDESDRRQIVVHLTEKGKAFYHEHLEYDRTEFALIDQNFLSRFTDDELRLFLEYETIMSRHFAQSVKLKNK